MEDIGRRNRVLFANNALFSSAGDNVRVILKQFSQIIVLIISLLLQHFNLVLLVGPQSIKKKEIKSVLVVATHICTMKRSDSGQKTKLTEVDRDTSTVVAIYFNLSSSFVILSLRG